MSARFDVVVPTVGRPTLGALLEALRLGGGPQPGSIVVVADGCPEPDGLPKGVRILRGRGAGPAAARNLGWRACSAEWVVFLDDDVVPRADWLARLAVDLDVGERVAGSQGRIVVPLPSNRRPTDWERNVKGLENAHFATADMAYRRAVLDALGGFDERFRRAFREDAELALRVLDAGYEIAAGSRVSDHPVRPAPFWTSVSVQAGNADDVLIRALHGRRWRERAGAPRGRRPVHLAVAAAGVLAVVGAVAGRRRSARAAALGWLGGTVELAARRILPGPRTPGEIVRMLVTSAAIPPVAALHWLAGWARVVRLGHRRPSARPAAVLFDRDGTLVEDVPYNGDPARVVAMPGARRALDRLRAADVPVGVISNQSGIGRGLLTVEQVEAVNARVEELLGPMDAWFYCPHLPDAACECRKPAPGMVVRAAAALGVNARDCAVLGDIGADVEAAKAAGARPVLVPTAKTRVEEITAAGEVARDLDEAIDLLLGEGR